MTEDFGFGIVGAEALEKLYHGLLLGWGASVGGIAVDIKSAFVANADTVGIVIFGMSTGHFLGTARIDGAVLGDVVVVADGAEAAGFVAGFEGFYREVAVGSGSRAMNYNQIDFSHDFLWILRINYYLAHGSHGSHGKVSTGGIRCMVLPCSVKSVDSVC